MAVPKVSISVLTDADTRCDAFRDRWLNFIFDRAAISPEFVGNYEPINNPVETWRDALPFWSNPFLWKRRRSPVGFGDIMHTSPYTAGAIVLRYRHVASVDWLGLFRDVVAATGAYYGYAHINTDAEWDEAEIPHEDLQVFALGAFSKTLTKGLLQLGWANYFGERWAEAVDPAWLEAHAAHVERLGAGSLFAVTPDIRDVVRDYAAFSAKRREIRRGFRAGVFKPR